MSRTETFYRMGFRVTFPDVFDHTKGLVSPMEIGDRGDGICFMMHTYIAATAEELAALANKSQDGKMSEEDSLKVAKLMGVLLVIIGFDSRKSLDEIIQKLGMGEVSMDDFTEIGRCNNLVYYAVTDRKTEEAYFKAIDPAFAEEFTTLQPAFIEALKNAEYFGPKIPGEELVGKTIHFETKDINGNPVKSEDLFSAHDVTMINYWATWCGPCKSELEELGNLHRRLEAENAAVIGICDDGADKADVCRALIAEKNLSYLNILPYEGIDELAVEAFPTTFFVNSEGKIMTPPIIGVPADISDYEKTIDSLLAKEEVTIEPAQTDAAEEMKENYRVTVTDEAGNPVSGVTVQFCSDMTCSIGRTDAEGTASFKAENGQYTVHVQKVPEDYAACSEEFAVPEDAKEVRITLKKA